MIRAIARLAVRNPVAVNLAMIAVIASGIVAFLGMPREVFPEFSLDQIIVSTTYPGASPEDVERQVTLPIEEEMEGIEDLDEVRSISSESLSVVTLELATGADTSDILDEVRSRLQSSALELPKEAEAPFTRELKTEFPVIAVFVYGGASEDTLRRVAREQELMIETLPGVSSVTVTGAREPELWVEVMPRALERYGITLGQIGALVGTRVRDTPLGSLSTPSGDYLLRVPSKVFEAEDLAKLPVLARPDGTVVRLDQVARIRDTFERQYTLARFNGLPSIHLQVNKQSDGDTIDLAEQVQNLIASERANMPAGVSLGTNSDLSIYVRNRLRVMTESGALGGLLVMISLVLFLNVRVALMTALGIPVAFLGGLLIASFFGISMNMITMFALIIVLGMIVDDAIVVSENGYRLMEEGLSPEEAAIEGTGQVGKPVIATILTTMAAFLPILLMDGMIGQFMRPLPLIVTFCLAASLVEALIVLPAHIAHWNSKKSVTALREVSGKHWYEPMRAAYSWMLERCVRFRYVTLVGAVSVALMFIGYATMQMPFNLFDDFESKVFYVNIHATPGSSLEETERLAIPIQNEVLALPEDEVESANLLVGILAQDTTRFELRHNLAQIWVELREDDQNRRATAEIIEDLRASFRRERPGIESIDVDQPQAGPAGKAIELSIRGPDLAVLEGIAERVKGRLAEFAGVRDIRDTAESGKREVELVLKDEARTLGVTELGIGAELRSVFEGTRFASIRRGRDDVEVVVKLPEHVRDSRGDLASLRVTTRAGARVPLSTVADLREIASQSVIEREQGSRSVRVTADVNKKEGNSTLITSALSKEFPDFVRDYPGYSIEFGGDTEDSAETLESLKSSLLVALVMIYVILGGLFKSYTQPVVIMLAIPLAAIGVVGGHILMSRGVSMMSLTGFLALSGIVVNDSLILVDRINALRQGGLAFGESVLLAGKQRFRPILLTSITTMLGLSPLTFFATGQAQFLQPMAISIFFGLAFSTFLILIVVPCAYAILQDVLVIFAHPVEAARRFRDGTEFHDEPYGTPSQ